ncbi:unnamed protein product [Callosobruchus maculatus]|uniref:Uncharacterized protein n=1 Tax=Callosobruchus maculatus TaxID=64391 RepID=A0A653DBE2_CALMS|nr:unnamed protein product [Callosobruchus maculatus]
MSVRKCKANFNKLKFELVKVDGKHDAKCASCGNVKNTSIIITA